MKDPYRQVATGMDFEVSFTHCDFNLGNAYMAAKDHYRAACQYIKVIKESPFHYTASKKSSSAKVLKFNSVSCYAHAWSNLAVIFLLLSTFARGTEAETRATTAA